MRNIHLLIAVAALLPVQAGAAVLPTKAYNAAPVVSCSWCGAYGGLTVGYGWSELKAVALEDAKFKPDGFLPGGVFGYRWEFGGKAVVGVEISGTYAGRSDSIFEGEASAKVKYFGDATAQVGLAVNSGIVAYALAGPAWANVQASIGDLPSTQNHFGWVLGGGIDIKALSNNWVIGLVYKHYELGDASYFGILNASAKMDVVQGRLLYRFTH